MSEARWLDPDEQKAWRAFLSAFRLLGQQLDRELQRDADIPLAYYVILVSLSEAPGREALLGELARLSGASPSRLSHALVRLEEQGWVSRRACPTDKRKSFATLTEAGFAKLVAAAPGHVEAVRRHLFDVLTTEQVHQLYEIGVAIRGSAGSTGVIIDSQ